MYHESNMSQFCQQGRAEVEYCRPSNNVWGMPVFGRPRGYGLGQIDPPPDPTVIWNWKSNADASNLGESTRRQTAHAFWMKQINDWRSWNQASPDRAAPLPADEWNPSDPAIQPRCLFRFSETPITGQPGVYWFEDAIVMKMFGGALVNYISFLDGTVTTAGRWVITRGNEVDANIVGELCTCATAATCNRNLTQ